MDKWCGTVTCSNCPWLKSSPPGEFSVERYIALKPSMQQGFGCIFACHKSREGEEFACVGAILRGGLANFNMRVLVHRRHISLEDLRATGPLYDSFTEMARANGVPDELLCDLGEEQDFILPEHAPGKKL